MTEQGRVAIGLSIIHLFGESGWVVNLFFTTHPWNHLLNWTNCHGKMRTEDSQGTYQSFGFTWKWTGDGCGVIFYFLTARLEAWKKRDGRNQHMLTGVFLAIQHHPNSEMEHFVIVLIGKHGTWTLKFSEKGCLKPSCQRWAQIGAGRGDIPGLERPHPFLRENWPENSWMHGSIQ